MIQVGIFTGYFPYGLEETATRIRKHGFNTVQLDLAFKDMDLDADQITKPKCKQIRETFRAHDLPVCCVSGYTNLVHPDKDERKRRLAHLKAIIRHARDLGSPYVISETGTFNPESDWVTHPKNRTEEGYETCRDSHRRPGRGGLRPWRGVPARNLRQQRDRLGRGDPAPVRDIDSPCLGLLMDPTNYFEAHNIGKMDGVLNQIFDSLNDKIRISHAKDVEERRRRQVREACRYRRRRIPTPSAASARSSCRRQAWARSTTTSISSACR